MNNFHNKNIGKIGENLAEEYLKLQGYKILCKNFYTYFGEIDIISKFNGEYIFIEVKTRKSERFGKPVEAVNSRKMKHFIDASNYYIYKNRLESEKIRFDIIEVYISDEKYRINHLKNILF